MRIHKVNPCSAFDGKIMITCSIGHSLDLKKLASLLQNGNFQNVVLFEKTNAIWLRKDMTSIVVFGSGEITVHGADSVNDATTIAKEIEKIGSS